MLSFAPRPDGTIPDDQVKLANEIGGWLKICGEAIYNTRPWDIFGERPTSKAVKSILFNAGDIRFTRNKAKTILYAIALDLPKDKLTIQALSAGKVNKNAIKSISLVGINEKLKWVQDANGLTIQIPAAAPSYQYAYPFKIEFNKQIPAVD